MEKPLSIVIRGLGSIRGKFELPVPPCCELALLPYRDVAWRQFSDVLINGLRPGDILVREEVPRRLRIESPIVSIHRQQTFQFRPEIEIRSVLPIIKRLNAEPVPCEEQFLLPDIPHGDCEHPSQSGNKVFVKILIQMRNTFRIRMRDQAMTSF